MDVAELAGEVTPFVTAAIEAYGSAVLTKAEDLVVDEAADSTVGLGRRILRRLTGRAEAGDVSEGEEPSPPRGADEEPGLLPEVDAFEVVVAELAEDPEDEDLQVVLVARLRKLLKADAEAGGELAADLQRMLAEPGGTVTASGDRSIAAHTISGIASTGDNATITQH
jgi:hypothetical protein